MTQELKPEFLEEELVLATLPSAEETLLLKALKRNALLSLAGYTILLLPTLLWLLFCLPDEQMPKRLMWDHLIHGWQATFWHFPGLSAKGSRLVLDIIRNGMIAWQAWLFFDSYRRLAAFKNLSGLTKVTLSRWLGLWLLAVSLLLMVVIPFHSTDLYGYLNRGFQQSLLETNPYLTPIASIPHWEQYPYLQKHWIFNPCPYGFVFAEAMRQVTSWTGENVALAALVVKAANALFLAISLGCVGLLAIQLKQPRPWLSVFLVGANPLVLLHALGNGHNDIWMLTCLLVAFCCLQRPDRQWLSLPILMMSILIKYLSVIALPFLCIYLWRQKAYRALFIGLAAAAVLLFMFALPYIPTEGHVFLWEDMLDNAGKSEHSLLASLSLIGGEHREYFLHWGKMLFTVGFTGLILAQMGRFWQTAKSEFGLASLMKTITVAMMALILVASAKFHPWYIVMFLPLAVLLPEASWLRRFALLLGLFQLIGFTGLQNIPVVNTLLLMAVPLYLIYYGSDPFAKTVLSAQD